MALEGETHLHDTPAQENDAHRADQAKDEVTQVVDHGKGIVPGGRGRYPKAQNQGHGQNCDHIGAEALSDRIAIMRDGRLLACDTAEKIKELAGKDNFEQAFVAIVKGGVQ